MAPVGLRLQGKTRTGCRQCKVRRIKCDETKPRCVNCSRTARECSLVHTTPVEFLQRRHGIANARRDGDCGAGVATAKRLQADDTSTTALELSQAEQSCSQTQETQASPGGTSSPFAYTAIDMRLLHHFFWHTGPTLSNRPRLQAAWQHAVTSLSFTHPFLLHGILAMSAMHIASLQPASRETYSMMAASHQNEALQGFRASCREVSARNCDALFAFSMLVVRYVPASAGTVINPDPRGSFLSGDLLDAVGEWLRLVRGTEDIVRGSGGWIKGGLLGVFLEEEDKVDEALLAARDEDVGDSRFRGLRRLWQGADVTAEEAEIYEQSLTSLQRIFARICASKHGSTNSTEQTEIPEAHDTTDDRFQLVFRWPRQMPHAYFDLLARRQPIALVLLGHYALVIKRACGDMWWPTPAPGKVLRAAASALGSEFQEWLKWPREEVECESRSLA